MARITRADSGTSAVGELLVLVDEAADSRVVIAPQRGALVTSFQVAGRELLYLEQATLEDATKNVRGGIPVLFPSPGPLHDGRFTREGKSGALKQHGFARNLAFRTDIDSAQRASATLTLASSAETLAMFPWPFSLALTFTLSGACLTLAVRLLNPGQTPLPFAFGLHPYFVVDDKARARIDTAATRVFDNVKKAEAPFEGFDLTAGEVDLHLLDHGSTRSALHLGDGKRIELRASADFERWVVWTLPGRDFVCVEPWTAPFDALNTGEGLLQVAPGATYEGQVELELR